MSNNFEMNNFTFNVKQLKMNKCIKYIWQLIISTSNGTLEVPMLRPSINHREFVSYKINLSRTNKYSVWTFLAAVYTQTKK